MGDEKITIIKDGKEIECDVLFTFDSEDTGKDYIGYTDGSIGPNGRKNIYVAKYDPLFGNGCLESITDDKEAKMVNKVLQEIEKKYRG